MEFSNGQCCHIYYRTSIHSFVLYFTHVKANFGWDFLHSIKHKHSEHSKLSHSFAAIRKGEKLHLIATKNVGESNQAIRFHALFTHDNA